MKVYFEKLLSFTCYMFVIVAFSTSCGKKQNVEPNNVNTLNVSPDTIDCNHTIKNGGTLINNTDAAVDYVVTCALDIVGDVTIEAGTVIEFTTDAGFEINGTGSLAINGSESNPVVLTATDKTPGSWKGILFDSDDTKNSMSYTQVIYAGGSSFNSNGDLGAVIVWSNSKLRIDNCIISYSSSYGLNASYGGAEINMTKNTFTKNNMPIKLNGDLIAVTTANNDYVGNSKDFVHVQFYTSEITAATIWHKINVPYLTYGTQLACRAMLTIEPGVEIHMGQSTYINIEEQGAISAKGTTEQPIIFRGETAVAGFWEGIVISFSANPLNEISNAKIMHAGGGNRKGGIYMWAKPVMNVNNVHFESIKTCALYAAPNTSSPNPNLLVSNCTYINCAGELCGD